MSAYSGTPTVVRAWKEVQGPGQVSARTLQLVLSTQGGGTNVISAASLGYARIDQCSAFVKSDNSAIYPGSPSYDGSNIYVIDSHAPTDISGTFQVTVIGQVIPTA